MEISVFNEQDHIFLPRGESDTSGGDPALIYYYNADADNGNGCFEKGRLWKNNILRLDKDVKGDAG